VIDIGAHVGTFSLLAAMVGYKRLARHRAGAGNFDLLDANLVEMAKTERIVADCIKAAIMPLNVRRGKLSRHKEGRSMMGVVAGDADGDVRCYDLDELLHDYDAGVVQDRHRGRRVRRDPHLPRRTQLRKPDEWLIECHPHAGDPEEIRRRLFDAGYAVAMYPDPNHKDGNAHFVASRIRVLASTPGVK
jgi:hypothetical protein